MFVLDASVALSWFFEDEASEESLRVRGRLTEERAVVPALWMYEVANAFVVASRRGRMTLDQAARAAQLLAELPIDVEPPGRDVTDLLDLAAAHAVSAYDASYLQLASLRGIPLATLDQRLTTAAKVVGVQLLSDDRS